MKPMGVIAVRPLVVSSRRKLVTARTRIFVPHTGLFSRRLALANESLGASSADHVRFVRGIPAQRR